jgi:hypothetical protein
LFRSSPVDTTHFGNWVIYPKAHTELTQCTVPFAHLPLCPPATFAHPSLLLTCKHCICNRHEHTISRRTLNELNQQAHSQRAQSSGALSTSSIFSKRILSGRKFFKRNLSERDCSERAHLQRSPIRPAPRRQAQRKKAQSSSSTVSATSLSTNVIPPHTLRRELSPLSSPRDSGAIHLERRY